MKTHLTIALLMLGITSLALAKDKRTLIEKIRDYENVKVYVVMDPVGHDPGTQGSSFFSGCKKFEETTAFTQEYKDMAQEIVDHLNQELKVGEALQLADASDVPTQTTFGMTTKDWSKTGEEYFAVLTIRGVYKSVANQMDKTIEHQLVVSGQIDFFQMDGDKVKKDNGTGLGNTASASKAESGCKDYDYFKENFPLNTLIDDFKTNYPEKLEKWVAKRLKKYKKATK